MIEPILGVESSMLGPRYPSSLCGRTKASKAVVNESLSEGTAADDEVVELLVDRRRLRLDVVRCRLLSAVYGRAPAAAVVASRSFICILSLDRVRGGGDAPCRVS